MQSHTFSTPLSGRMAQEFPQKFHITSTDGLSIACVKWSGHRLVQGVVQIAHGLGEHIGRYAELAETLVERDFVVYGNDHRGHGLTAKPLGSFGDFGPGGFDQLVQDMVALSVIAKNGHPGKPYILLGTAWVLLPRNNSFSTKVIRSTAWRFPGPALWMDWLAWPGGCPAEKTR
jgi:hypothetical protein